MKPIFCNISVAEHDVLPEKNERNIFEKVEYVANRAKLRLDKN